MARTVVLRLGDSEYQAVLDGDCVSVNGAGIAVRPAGDGAVRVGEDPPRMAWTAATRDVRWVYYDGRVYEFEVAAYGGRRRPRGHHGSLAAPMPATVRRVQAAVGDRVKRGDPLIILEAMKMELPVRATTDGVVTAVNCREGELVSPGASLIEIDDTESAA